MCFNGLDRTSFLNKEQSSVSSQLHCVVMAIDDFHHSKMMKRNEELTSKEITCSGRKHYLRLRHRSVTLASGVPAGLDF